jgi:hypothetical protein
MQVFGPFTPGDSFRVYQLQRKGVSLDLQRGLTQPHIPLWEAYLAFLTQQAMGQPTHVLTDAHDGEAFVQVRYRPHQAAADVTFVAPALMEKGRTARAWLRLLDGACIEAAGRGIQRVFVNAAESSAEADVFHQAGFTLYAGEEIFWLSRPDRAALGAGALEMRARRPEDWPAIQKLCVAITPQRVRQTEGGIVATTGSEKSVQRYVLPAPEGDDLVATVHLSVGGRGSWLRVLLHPDARHLAEDVIHWSLAALNEHRGKPVYCNVRQYESGMRPALEEVGFEDYGKRALMVKHTVAWAKAGSEPVPTLKTGAEAVPPAYHINGEPEFQVSNRRLAAKRDL